MKNIIRVFFGIFAIFNAYAQSPVYIVPGVFNPTHGFFVQMFVNNQGPFNAEIDTGSTFFMVPGDADFCPSCHQPVGVSPTKKIGQRFVIHYGTGRILVAHAYQTNIQPLPTGTIDSAPAVSQTIGLVNKVEGNDNASPVLGMAQPPAHLPFHLMTYMQALMHANVTKDLGFMLIGCMPPAHGTELILGGPDPRLQGTNAITTPLVRKQTHFYITPLSLSTKNANNSLASDYSGNFAQSNFSKNASLVLIDSGSSNIHLPDRLFYPLIQVLSQTNPSIPKSFWKHVNFPLTQQQINSLPTLVITLQNKMHLYIPPKNYIFPVNHGSNGSQSQFMISSAGKNGQSILGDPLFMSYAILLDRSTETASFYPTTGLCW